MAIVNKQIFRIYSRYVHFKTISFANDVRANGTSAFVDSMQTVLSRDYLQAKKPAFAPSPHAVTICFSGPFVTSPAANSPFTAV